MATSTTTNTTTTQHNGASSSTSRSKTVTTLPPRPPYDAELAVVRDTYPPFGPITNDFIVALHSDPDGYGPLPTASGLIAGRPITHCEYEVASLKPDDPPVTLSVFSPCTSTPTPDGSSSAGPLRRPCIYFMHGGAMIFLNRLFGLEQPLEWVMETGCVLVSVEYRLAPENPQPAALHDCWAGLLWLHDTAAAARLGIDTDRIIVAGHSGGSCLAAGLALLARDAALAAHPTPGLASSGSSVPSRTAPIRAQLLGCPMIDDRNDTASARQYHDGGEPWDGKSNAAAWAAVLGNRGDDYGPGVSEYFAPARAASLAGLPEAWVDVGSADPFRDEAVTYASRLWEAGVQAELHVWPGGFHGFDVMAPDSVLGRRAKEAKLAWIKRIFAAQHDQMNKSDV
ncbi:hypothetical protein LMH87_000339 [Akanthomyces muscarius]|uniref:Alpha/beta hydrolase fold-3 domain-containing protein n=1 Tax=Akanthomyces muscarius TaxID=2231603 RepID=A0A9W8UL09_AKAMU|nr:hypothetical protein LMH87_000339 [Akanthomyces muscarius]KAJ4155073.1 hypothetical protein LMH87_000339 [Akanthomyces muscarius]